MAGKFALLVGNSAFRHSELERLSAPPNDVLEFKGILEDPGIAGFDGVELKMDSALVDVRGAIGRLYRDRHPDDLVLFYYSGHGLRDRQGDFYLALTEADPEAPDAGSIDEHFLRRLMDGSLSRRQLVILDCCHSGAFIPEKLTPREAQASPQITARTFDPDGYGRFIMTATTAELSAFEEGGRSLYTHRLVEGLKTGGAAPEKEEISVHDLHDFVMRKVVEETDAPMKPQLWVDASTNPRPLLLARNPDPRQPLPQRILKALWGQDSEKAEWAVMRLAEMVRGPSGHLADDARRVLRERLESSATLNFDVGRRIEEALSADMTAESGREDRAPVRTAETATPAPSIAEPPVSEDSHGAVAAAMPSSGVSAGALHFSGVAPGDTFRDCPECPEMVVIPGGTFTMGSPPDEAGRYDNERQKPGVQIDAFAIARTPVTFAQWDACVADGKCPAIEDDEGWGRGSHPVINVSWNDAQTYIAWLNAKVADVDPYSLPSEAQWEYAARAGTVTPFAFGETISTDQANYKGNYTYGTGVEGEYRRRTVAVDELEAANAWGLRHMHGNVWEWVEDVYENDLSKTSTDGSAHVPEGASPDSRRVVRGGSWSYKPRFLRSAFRYGYGPGNRNLNVGFRPSRTLIP